MRNRGLAATLAGLTLVAVACGGGGGSTAKGGSSTASSAGSSSSSSSSKSSSSGSSGGSSGGSKSPTQAITDAVSASGQGSGIITFGLFGSAADFQALSPSSGTTSAKDLQLADKLLPTSTLNVAYEAGSGSGQGKADISFTLGSDQKAVEAIVVPGTLYLHIDVSGIESAVGGDPSKIQAEAGAAEGQFPFIKTLLDGGYVSLDLKSLAALGKQFAGAGAGAATTPTTVGQGQVKAMIAGLKSALTAGTQVTKVGSDSVGDHYQVVVMPQQLVAALQQDATAAAGPLSSEIGKADSSLSKVPNKPVTVDVWLSGGKLKQLELDLRQFHQGTGGPTNPVGLKITFASESGSISAPSGATPVDLSSLGGLLGGLAGKSGA